MKTDPSSIHRLITGFSLLGLALGLGSAPQAHALPPTLWTGPMISFTDAPGADPTLPANQDRLTPNVWITRGTSQGIYNIKTEAGFTAFVSPADTEWADGTIANYSTLTYMDWEDWARNIHGGPPYTVGVPAVLHLLSDNIYVSVEFLSWGGAGGGFSYERSTPVVPEPAPGLLLLAGLAVAAIANRREGMTISLTGPCMNLCQHG